MAWIELHQTLPQNKKILRLCSVLKMKTPHAVGHMCMLWLWAMDNAEDGDLSEFMNEEIAIVVGYDIKQADKFMDALRTSGFVDADNRIHDWDNYIGKLVEKRKSDAERKRTSRGSHSKNTEYNTDSPSDVQRTSDGQDTEIHQTSSGNPCDGAGNRTLPYLTNNNIDITDVISLSPDGNSQGETTKIRYQEIADLYNGICSGRLPKCTKMSEARKAAIRARLNSGYNLDDIELVFKKAAESPFLRGGNSKNWHADFDWLLNDANMAKVLDGKYDSETAIGIENKTDEKGDF